MADGQAIVRQESASAQEIVARAGSLDVRSTEENEAAAVLLREIKSRAKAVEEQRLSLTRPLDQSKANIMDMFRPILTAYSDAEKQVKGTMLLWEREEQKRLAAEREEAARERAEIEAAAIRAAEQGEYERAAELQFERSQVMDPVRSRPAGTSIQTRWQAEVTDLQSLVLAVASGDAPLSLIQADMIALRKLAQATHAPSTIPGVRFWSEQGIAASGR